MRNDCIAALSAKWQSDLEGIFFLFWKKNAICKNSCHQYVNILENREVYVFLNVPVFVICYNV